MVYQTERDTAIRLQCCKIASSWAKTYKPKKHWYD